MAGQLVFTVVAGLALGLAAAGTPEAQGRAPPHPNRHRHSIRESAATPSR